MSEHLKPTTTPQSHAQTLREDAGRLLSRSPHPYHRQYFELPHPSERLNAHTPTTPSALRSTQQTDDEEQDTSRSWSERYRGSGNSDSGTEADDEHFLKGLPAPKSRPHKGLRGIEGTISGSASPLLTPSILDEQRKGGIYWASTSPELSEQNLRMTANKLRIRRRATIVRRIIEAALLLFLGGLLALNPAIRSVMWMWRKELVCQILVISLLIAIYPLRLLRYLSSRRPWKSHIPLEIPAAWDPAPLFYPPAITMLVSFVISSRQPKTLLPSIILSIASLPKSLIPAIGELSGANTLHWFFSCLPFLVSQNLHSISPLVTDPLKGWDGELLVLLFPLHQALCTTLQYLTTTSLLAAELQLLSTALVELLLLSTSPQTTILKSLLWGGGVGLLVSCENVLRWVVALARVPKWRFRRARSALKPLRNKQNPIERLSKAVFSWDEDDFSEEDELAMSRTRSESPNLKLSTYNAGMAASSNGSTSAVERQSTERTLSISQNDPNSIQRRHTLPILSSLPPRSSKRTPSGRKKRAASSSVQSFFHLTQKQATVRKWAYAGYVYLCVLVIILVGIREYVGKYALHENEPVGWALGYLFGDIQRFRMEVVTANLQRWILLPPRNELENKDSCPMGWVEHLRHATFGAANTRLILTAYWLGVIIVGLAIVFRLSAIYEVDTRRKVFHFMMVAMLLPATYVDPTFAALALSLVLAVFLLLDLFRASQLPPLSKSLASFLTPYVDGRDLKGPVVISHIFLLIGCAIPLWLSLGSLPRSGTDALQGWEVPSREVSMVSGVICVGLGDAAASLIGRRYGRRKWLWGGGKSIEGSVAFATAVGSALLLAKAWLRIGGWPTHNHDSWVTTVWKSGVAAGVASLTEAVLTGGNDNVVVPIVLWLCVKGLDI